MSKTDPSAAGSPWLSLLLILGATFAMSGLGGAVTTPEIGGWYRTLEKPPFNPPDWIFGPVWTLLFVMMAAARPEIVLYAVQLVLNLAWSVLFFGMRSPELAFAEIFLLLASIVATGLAFHRVRPLAGWLFVPYFAWVSFASVLNGWIAFNN
ncbi:MAG TPA: TspO/MBR family protein [Azospirillaceae bacterium]|nr:TspO/MBR family protein [Azospirillaceae bacterium]